MKFVSFKLKGSPSFGIYNDKSDADLFVSSVFEAKKFFN